MKRFLIERPAPVGLATVVLLLACTSGVADHRAESEVTLSHPAYRRAVELLGEADASAARGDQAMALRQIQEGLDLIGTQYMSADTIDDTGQKLVLSEIEEKKGDLERARSIRRNVLDSRLTMYKRKLGTERQLID